MNMKHITNKWADNFIAYLDLIDEALQMLRPVLKKRKLRFGTIYYIMGMQIVIYDKEHRKPHYPDFR